MKKKIIAGILLIGACVAHAQQGIGTNKPHSSAALDIKADNKGVLIPRVKLTSTTDKTKIKKPINSLLVYNEGTTVPKGYYYWLNNKWVKIIDAENLPTEDTSPAWQDANGKASKKPTDNIKRTGSVSIGNTTTNSEKFAVKGATKLDGTLNVTGNTALNGTLEVTGKTTLKTTSLLTSTNVSSLFVDKDGNVGTAEIKKESEIAFYKSSKGYVEGQTQHVKFNAGTEIIVPINSSDEKLNSINAIVENSTVKITKKGTYLLSGSVNLALTFKNNQSVYIAVLLELKRNGEQQYRTISGGRPIFKGIDIGVPRFYPFTIPTVLEKLKAGDLLKITLIRTTDGSGLQGTELKEFGIGQLYGAPAYTISITKL